MYLRSGAMQIVKPVASIVQQPGPRALFRQQALQHRSIPFLMGLSSHSSVVLLGIQKELRSAHFAST